MLLINTQKLRTEIRYSLLHRLQLFLFTFNFLGSFSYNAFCFAVGIRNNAVSLLARFSQSCIPHFLCTEQRFLNFIFLSTIFLNLLLH